MDLTSTSYFEKYLLEELTEQEAIRFEQRLSSDEAFSKAFENYLKEMSGSIPSPPPPAYSPHRAWEKISQHIHADAGLPPARTPRKTWNWRLVASLSFICMVVAASIWLIDPKETSPTMLTKVTPPGQKATVTLSDGTTIRLNAGSKLTYPEVFDDSIRLVALEGEAFFEVTPAPNRPFIIRTGNMTTRVIGTSFNIHAFPDENIQQVAVQTGVVQVIISGGKTRSIQLSPGKMANYDQQSGQWWLEEVDPGDIAYWARGYLYFDNEPLVKVFQELGRWYGVEFDIQDPAILNCRITLKQRDQNLKNVLNIIKFATHVNYQFNNKKIIITGSAC